MATRAMLRGYLLEEALAWLLRESGYRLLVREDQDPYELVADGITLRVKGRGAVHQVDVLGEFPFTPAFSLPVRLFLEAKFYRTPCRLDVVRNAHGVVHDVNENFVTLPGRRPRRRFKYSYALFSANGFTEEAQEYALAHQISLVDLSGQSFEWLRTSIADAASDLYDEQIPSGVRRFPVTWMRGELRLALGTGEVTPVSASTAVGEQFRAAAGPILDGFVAMLNEHSERELLLGFPAAPFILPLAAADRDRFLAYADTHPDHPVRIRRVGHAEAAEWMLTPREAQNAYRLTFKLPDHVETWIGDIAGKERQRIQMVKEQFLAAITVYRVTEHGLRSYLLRYEPSDLLNR
ncbi:restriction endonuclease [Streptomyces sp. NBC_01476]|uniref:hypothetical protein n=1 Tax=Streptomyces sp. NBC_01476 TaxID=2903881 RepID=UPI002E341E58|nr:hypothetical protein [Streptomyces sp. NBC_01476]